MAYLGQAVPIPIGQDGLTGNQNLSLLKPSQLTTATNISYDQGNLRKEGGAARYNETAISGAPSIIAGWDWHPTPGTQRMVVFTGVGSLLKDTGGGGFTTVLASGLNTTGTPTFAEGGQETLAADRKLFLVNGFNPVRVLAGDAATASTIASPAADWSGSQQPISMCNHDGRMWGALGHRIYFSTRTNHEDFADGTNAGSLAIFPGIGERIIQIMSFKGLLIVWKFPVGIYVVNTADATVANWTVSSLSTTIGGVSPCGAVQVIDDVLFVDAAGNFQLLSGIQEFGQVGLSNLSHVHTFSPFMRQHVNFARLSSIRSVFYAYKLEAHFTVTQLGSGVNDARVVVDFNRPDISRFRWSPRDICESIWLRTDSNHIPRLVIGDTSGFVWELDQDTFSKGDEGYTSELVVNSMAFDWLDPSLAVKRKNGGFIEVVVDPTGNWHLSCDVTWDQGTPQTVEFNLDPGGAVLGSFILGTDVLGGASTIAQRRRLPGSGKRLTLRFYNTEMDEDFNLSQVFISFNLSDERTPSV